MIENVLDSWGFKKHIIDSYLKLITNTVSDQTSNQTTDAVSNQTTDQTANDEDTFVLNYQDFDPQRLIFVPRSEETIKTKKSSNSNNNQLFTDESGNIVRNSEQDPDGVTFEMAYFTFDPTKQKQRKAWIEIYSNMTDILQEDYHLMVYPYLCKNVTHSQLVGLVLLGMDLDKMLLQACIQGRDEFITPLIDLGAVPTLGHLSLIGTVDSINAANSISTFDQLVKHLNIDTTNEVLHTDGRNVIEAWMEHDTKLPLHAVYFGFKGNQACLEQAIELEDTDLFKALLNQGIQITDKMVRMSRQSSVEIEDMITDLVFSSCF